MQKKSISIEQNIMAQVKSGKIVMKPRWHFILGSILMSSGLVGCSIGAIFLTNLSFFLLRQHGPCGEWRLQLMLSTFPWWVPMLALLGILVGVFLLKKYDFSYKKNFFVITTVFVVAIIFAALIIDVTDINSAWFGRGQRFMYEGKKRHQNSDQLFCNTMREVQ